MRVRVSIYFRDFVEFFQEENINFTRYSAFSITISENSPVFANRHNTGTVGIQVFAKVLTQKPFQFYRLGGTEDLTGQKRLKKEG